MRQEAQLSKNPKKRLKFGGGWRRLKFAKRSILDKNFFVGEGVPFYRKRIVSSESNIVPKESRRAFPQVMRKLSSIPEATINQRSTLRLRKRFFSPENV